MNLNFYKYQGTGNDFVMVDDRAEGFDDENLSLVKEICDRKFGIGADGLILIRNHSEFDFEMIYFNADGSQSMCGNGARCAVAFSKFLRIVSGKTNFLAIDGPHEAIITSNEVELKMANVDEVLPSGKDVFVDTGSPHHIRMVEDVKNYQVFEQGKQVRNHESYSPKGTNVNFVQEISDSRIFVRTYERGVENETLSCGTGVTAAALAYGKKEGSQTVKIETLGGQLSVKFNRNADGSFQDIWLIGPAKQVYKGQYQINELPLES